MLCLTIPHHDVVGVWPKFHLLVYPSALECTGDGPWQSEVERCTGKSRLQWQWHKDNDEKDADDCCIRTVSSILTWKPFPLLQVSEDRVDPSTNENSQKQIQLHYLYLKGKEKGFGKGSLGKIVPVPYGSDRMQIGACGSGETFLFLDSKPIAPLCKNNHVSEKELACQFEDLQEWNDVTEIFWIPRVTKG